MRGAQFSVIVNSGTSLEGAQFSLVNVAAGPVQGAQFGFVNISSAKVKGAQFGLVNVADESSLSLGLFNIIRNGRLHLDLWGMESGILMAGIKHGGSYFHNVYGIGARVIGGRPRLSLSLGLGAHFNLSEHIYLDTDGLAYSVHDGGAITILAGMLQARAVLGIRLARGFAVYGGPTYNTSLAPRAKDALLSLYGSLLIQQDKDMTIRSWPGVVLGIQAF